MYMRYITVGLTLVETVDAGVVLIFSGDAVLETTLPPFILMTNGTDVC